MEEQSIVSLKEQINRIQKEKSAIVEKIRGAEFMQPDLKGFAMNRIETEYNQRIRADFALIHELEGQK